MPKFQELCGGFKITLLEAVLDVKLPLRKSAGSGESRCKAAKHLQRVNPFRWSTRTRSCVALPQVRTRYAQDHIKTHYLHYGTRYELGVARPVTYSPVRPLYGTVASGGII